jgi:hypothetical protein
MLETIGKRTTFFSTDISHMDAHRRPPRVAECYLTHRPPQALFPADRRGGEEGAKLCPVFDGPISFGAGTPFRWAMFPVPAVGPMKAVLAARDAKKESEREYLRSFLANLGGRRRAPAHQFHPCVYGIVI